ncbi:MAG TPA: TetR/AcrR family transcriptional regulator [Clostridiales bacterium]|nr:TetR/AcrR family transcriptional regulator [Clostridiales bacterium]
MRNEIINAAGSIFSRKGFYKASMDEIAVEAGVAKGTLYYYFKNKSELFRTVVVEGIDYLVKDLISLANSSDDSIENIIKSMIKTNIDYYLDYYELANIVLNEITSGIDDDVLKEIKNSKDKYIEFLAELLSNGYKQGIICYSDFNLLAAGIIGMINGICKYYLMNSSSVDRNSITEHACNMIMKGLFPK